LYLYDSIENSHENDISPVELDTWLSPIKSNNTVIILDTCLSADFLSSLSAEGRVLMSSVTKGELSWQDALLKHGVFSYYLIDGLQRPDRVDSDEDGKVTVQELFQYSKAATLQRWELFPPPSPQTPCIVDNTNQNVLLFRIGSR